MEEKETFHAALLRLIAKDKRRSTYTPGQLASLTGIKKSTLVHWLQDEVKRPRDWRKLVALATILYFDETEVNELLRAARHPTVVELWDQITNEADRKLLAPWPRPRAPFGANVDFADFTGRADQLAQLEEWLSQKQFAAPLRLSGMPGIGKTVLAAHAAKKFQALFPDGVLWEDMEGEDLLGTLAAFAHSLGYDLAAYRSLSSRSRAFRNILANKRVLIILDGVTRYDDVTPFLPHTPATSAVIITTRRGDLGISRAAYPLHLEQFQPEEAAALFAKILGADRAQEEQEALAALAVSLDYLPIALNIAAHQIKKRHGSTAADFLTRLQKAENQLEHLADKERSVQALFETSYAALTRKQQQFFATLSAFAGREFGVDAAAYVTGYAVLRTEDLLLDLRDLSLLQETKPRRFRLHALLNEFARANNLDPLASNRLVEFYCAYAQEHHREHAALALEYSNLIGALQVAHTQQMYPELVQGVGALVGYWDTQGLYDPATTWLGRAADMARQEADRAALARIWSNLGLFELYRGNAETADARLQEGLALARARNDAPLVAELLNRLGILRDQTGKLDAAERYYTESLALFRELGDLRGVSRLLLGLGGLASDMGQLKVATERLQEALQLARQLNDLDLIGVIFNNLGATAGRQGDYAAEEAYYEEALAIARRLQNRLDMCFRLANLGSLALTKGNYEMAQAHLEEALTIAHEIGHPERSSTVLRLMGELALAQDDHTAAEAFFQRGLTHVEEAELPISKSALLADLGLVQVYREDYEQAATNFATSLALARQAGHAWYLVDALNKQGELFLQQHDAARAAEIFNEALKRGRTADLTDLIPDTLFGQARVAALQGEEAAARALGQASLSLYADLGHHKAAKVRQWMSQFDAE